MTELLTATCPEGWPTWIVLRDNVRLGTVTRTDVRRFVASPRDGRNDRAFASQDAAVRWLGGEA